MKVTFRHEAPSFGNKSESQTYYIDAGEFAVMIDTDRARRAAADGTPLEETPTRDPQAILDEMWRDEENVAHEAHRGDRGPGKETCTCGHGCKPRRGCRTPKNHPRSLDAMLDNDIYRIGNSSSVEKTLIAQEEKAQRAAEIDAMREVIAGLPPRQREVLELMLTGMKNADIARHLNVSCARITQLASPAKKAIRQAVEQVRLNTSGASGSGVKGVANGANPMTTKGR